MQHPFAHFLLAWERWERKSNRSSDSDDQESKIQSLLRKTEKRSHAHTGQSLQSGKETKVTSTVLYPQWKPHCYLSITHGHRDTKYEELTLAEFVAGYGQILLSPDLSEVECSSHLKHLVFLMYFPSFTTGRLYWVSMVRFCWRSNMVYSDGSIHFYI